MQWTAVKQNWPAFAGPIMQRWPETDEVELLAVEGDRDRLAEYLAARHDLTPAEAEEQISVWLQGVVPSDVVVDETRDGERIRASGAGIPPGEDVYSDDRKFSDDHVPDRPDQTLADGT